jgi:hypothetical protein
MAIGFSNTICSGLPKGVGFAEAVKGYREFISYSITSSDLISLVGINSDVLPPK